MSASGRTRRHRSSYIYMCLIPLLPTFTCALYLYYLHLHAPYISIIYIYMCLISLFYLMCHIISAFYAYAGKARVCINPTDFENVFSYYRMCSLTAGKARVCINPTDSYALYRSDQVRDLLYFPKIRCVCVRARVCACVRVCVKDRCVYVCLVCVCVYVCTCV